MKKKLLIVLQATIGVENNVYKGKDIFVEYYNRLSEHWDVTLLATVSPSYKSFHAGVINNNVRVVALSSFPWRSIFEIIAELRRTDMTMIFMPTKIGIAAALAAKILRRKFVVYEGGDQFKLLSDKYRAGPWLSRLLLGWWSPHVFRCMESWVARLAKVALVTGDDLFKFYALYNRHVIKTVPIIKVAATTIETRPPGPVHQPVRLLFVGNIHPNKGLDSLLEAMGLLVAEVSVRLQVVGTGASLDHFKRKAMDLGLDGCIDWCGYVPNGECLYEYYRRADIFILPSFSEGMPRVLYEAACFSLPILATPVGGVPNFWKDGVDLLSIRVGDGSDIRDKVLFLVRHEDDRIRLGRTAQEKMASFLKEPAWLQHHKIFTEVLGP